VRVFIGGVGYRNLQDYSFGLVVVDALVCSYPSSQVKVEDISDDPIAVVQRLQEESATHPFDLGIFVGSAQRRRRKTGTLSVYRWDRIPPAPDAVQGAISEAASGVIALDNVLVIAQHFNVLPPTVVVMELEPATHQFGNHLSSPVQLALARTCELVATLIGDASAASRIPEGRLALKRPPVLGFVSAPASDVVY
jgi:Ni,Fe-hydrogenase maturation factor